MESDKSNSNDNQTLLQAVMIYRATYNLWEQNEYLLCKEKEDYYVVIGTPNKKTHSWKIGDEFRFSRLAIMSSPLKLTPVSVKFYCNKFRGRG